MTDHADTIRRDPTLVRAAIQYAPSNEDEARLQVGDTWVTNHAAEDELDQFVAERQQAIDERDAAQTETQLMESALEDQQAGHVDDQERWRVERLELRARCEQAIDALREIAKTPEAIRGFNTPAGTQCHYLKGLAAAALVSLGETE